MPASLRLMLIGCSALMLLYAAYRIRRSAMRLEDSIVWILMGAFFILISVFPDIIYGLCAWLGIMSPSNLVYLIVIAFLMIQVFYDAIKISALSGRVDSLAQELALRDERFLHLETEDERLAEHGKE